MPSQRIKLRRGTTAQQQNFTGAEGEVTFDTDKNTLIVHDGTTKGGHVLPRDTDVKTDIDQLTDAYGILESYVSGFSGTTETYTITVAAASSGGGNVFYITGLENPHIVLTPGNRYIFDVSDSSNTGHPLYFTADDGTTNYTTGVSRIGTEGTAGAKVIFIIPADVPALKYYCSVHGLSMGNQISSVLNTPSSGGSSSLASFDISPALPTGETSWNLATDGDLSITEAGNWTFTATGDGTVDLSMKGAGGGYGKDTNALGGAGGETTGKISVTSGDTFIVTVGSKGVQSGGAGAYGGGGAGGNLTLPGSGGGYSGIFEGAEQQSKSILIAGGGGGGHGWDAGSATGNGGSGGGAEGTAGTAGSSGGGATQTGGGAGAGNGTAGTPLTGGTGGTRSTNQGSGGGGGGGYFGGGGGAAGSYNGNQNGTPGGGGSGYIGGTSNFAVTDGVTTAGAGSTTEVDGTFSMVGQVATTEETTGPTVTTYNLLSGSSKTGLLITTDGEAGVNSSFTDSSTTAATVTAGGNSVQLSTFSPYRHGGYSTHFDGTGDHITIPSNSGAPFDFGTDNFTIEGWFYLTTSGSWTSYWGISQGGGAQQKINLYDASGDGTLDVDVNGSVVFSSSAVLTDLQNKWAHIALVREGTGTNQTKLYVNGLVVGQGTVSTNFSGFSQPFTVGHNGELYSGAFYGYISDFRVVSSAVYTEDFTPPTERLTAIDGTQLLTCHLPYIADGSSNSATITLDGDVHTEPLSPYDHIGYIEGTHGGSVYFDQTGISHSTVSRMQVGSASPDYDLSGGGTVEAWVYLNSYAGGSLPDENRPIWCFYNTSYNGVTKYYSLNIDNNGYLAAKKDYNGFGLATSTTKIPLNTWTHVVFTTTGTSGTNKFYVNGKDVTSTFTSFAGTGISEITLNGYFPGSTGNNDYELWVGAIKYAYNGKDYIAGMDGYISDFRVFKGDIVYSEDFTPPTETLTAVTNTQVLIGHNVSDGDTEFTDGSTSGRTITKYDTPVGSSLGPATGMTSILFDGTNDYLTLPSSADFDLGTDDFTIEFWIYLTNSNPSRVLTNRRTAAGANGTWAVNMSTTTLSFTEVISGEPGPSVTGLPSVENKWCHVAVVRDNGVTTIYRDGNSVVSAAQTTNFTNSSYPLYVMTSPSETFVGGYLSNARIVKGTAIYSDANGFTPPLSPLSSTDSAAHIKGVEGHIIDKAQSGNKFTLVGNTVASIAESKYSGSSIVLDGDGDHIQLENTPDIDVSTGDFTWEGWFNWNDISNNPKIFVSLSSATAYWQLYVYNSKLTLRVNSSQTVYGVDTVNISTNQWYHIALVRSGDTFTVYKDGVAVITDTYAGSIGHYTDNGIGGMNSYPASSMNGYMEDVRLSKFARYTEDFTVPNAALEAPQVVQSEGSYTVATGGTITTDGNYKYHTFTEDGTFSITSLGTNTTIDVLAVGGGGGGGGSADSNSGGGGAGGYLEGSITAEVQSYDIVIGQGGAGGVGDVGASGGDTTISVLNATAIGGGYGGGGARSQQTAGAQGGSGGGGGGFPNDMAGGAGIQGDSGGLTGYGNAGGSAGSYAADGGGGAGSAGGPDGNPRAGGTGRQWLDGNFYAGGGGAASDGPGGSGVGGTGANGDNDGGHALPNTGGGGAGSYAGGPGSSSTGGNGGSGVVIFRYPYQGTVTETAPTSTSYRYMKVVLNSVSSGTQAQVTEISFTGENGATDFITDQTITNWYGTGSTATSQSPTIALVNNAQSPQNSEHTNLDTLPFTLEYDLGASYIHGTQLRYLQLGSSDSAYRYPTSVTVYGATQPDFSDEVALITNSVQAYASVNSNTLIDLGTSITGGSAGSATFSDLLAVTGHPINVYDDTREQRETTNAFSGTHSLYINSQGSTRRSPQDTSGYTYTDYTISFWARMESWNTYNGTRINWLTNGPKYQEGNSHGDGAIYVVDNSNEVGFVTQRYNGSLYHYISGTASSSFATDAWYHFVVTGDATNNTATLTVSSDGGTFGDMINASTFTTGNQVATLTPQNLYLAGSSGNAANGAHQIRYDLYGIWDRVLDATERQAVFDAGATHDHPNLPTSGLKLYYTFDNDYNNYSNS